MTTRTGHKWLVVHADRGAFVARRDSPAARQALRQKTITSKFRTMRGAYSMLALLRVAAQVRAARS